jgi:GxxExxY protein
MAVEIIEKELSYRIVQAAYEVFNALGPGFQESLYEEAIAIELRKRGHLVERQKKIMVYFKGQPIGTHVLDMLVDDRVILELKAIAEIAPVHKQQALSYLKSTTLLLALVINFGAHRLQVERIVQTKFKDDSRHSPYSRLSR